MRRWLLVLLIAVTAMPVGTARADHVRRKCGTGTQKAANRIENKRMIRCLTRQPGLRVEKPKALRIANCESGYYAKATSASGTYRGIYQLGSAEFDTFKHQGPRWIDHEFRTFNYGIYSARGNALAALAHAYRYGWGAWECQ